MRGGRRRVEAVTASGSPDRDGQAARPGFELAQVNFGRLTAPVDSPELAGFMAALDPVNAAADLLFRHIRRVVPATCMALP